MTADFVRVGDVLELQRRAVDVDITASYREIGVRSFGRGIFHKEPVSGLDLGNKRVFRIEPGDLVLSNVFAWEGAIALAGPDEEGRIGSHRFMTYRPVDEQIDAAWASWFFLSEVGLELIREASPGSAGRNRTLAIERFENLKIPLPPIDEQRRVVTRLGGICSSADLLTVNTTRAAEISRAITVSIASRPDLDEQSKRDSGWVRVALREVMTQASDSTKVAVNERYPNLGIYSYGRGVFDKPPIDRAETSAKTLNRVRAGQFIYSRLFAFEGAYAYVPDAADGYFVSNEFPTFDADGERLDARWLAYYLRSPSRWDELKGSSKGLGVRRQRVPVDAILEYEIWLAPREKQTAALRQIDRLEQATEYRARLNDRVRALVPAALNEAFAHLS